MSSQIGIVGLGVMGHNLALNMERNGFPVAGYDLDSARTRAFLEGAAAGKNITGVESDPPSPGTPPWRGWSRYGHLPEAALPVFEVKNTY